MLSDSQKTLEGVRTENATLKASLEEFKDSVFSMQPTQWTTDSQLGGTYTNLCDRIEYWVENFFGELEEPLLQMVQSEDAPTSWLTEQEWRAVGNNPALNVPVLTALFGRYLQATLLSKELVYPGLDVDVQAWLYKISHGMSNVKPAKGLPSRLDPASIPVSMLTKTRSGGRSTLAS